ncbi:MAG TPA: hypothetical protein VGN25_05910 [Solirubrobacteraceae bacterium]|nr:hypothetical protein [Solirubrobacteraceae bacterium]
MPAALLIALLAVLIVVPAAMAGKPTGEYKVFADCPLSTPGVNECVYNQFTHGELTFGTLHAPVEHPITLQGGLIVTEKEETFKNTTEGQTLSNTEQEVPGGLAGIGGSEATKLWLSLELVGTVTLSRSNLAAGKGTALKLPVRVHLKNVFLGEECFIGSSASPITLNLTTGATSPPPPNKSIKGAPGTLESKEEGNLTIYRSDSLVENAFSVPTVSSSCGGGVYKGIMAPLLNSKYQLPSAAGHSTAILSSGTSELASAEAVRKSE